MKLISPSKIKELFKKPEPPKQPRHIFFNQELPAEYRDAKGEPVMCYPHNKVRTTKYTAWNFLAKNITLQFMNIANCYFLFIIILGAFQIFGVQSPAMQAVPLIVIVALTSIKDAFEDFRRARADHQMNTSKVHRLCGLTNPNIIIKKKTLSSRLSDWWSRKLWAAGDAVAEKVKKNRKVGSSAKNSASPKPKEHTEKPSNSIPARPSVDGSSSLPGLSNINTVHSYAPSLGSLAPSLVSNVSDVSGVGSLAPVRASLSTVRCTGRLTPFVPETVSNPNIIPTKNACRFRTTYWEQLNVGDIIRVRENEEIPCDCVVLSSSDRDGICYVETKNLDGETSLRRKSSLKCGSGLVHSADFERAAFEIDTEPPSRNLYKFRGVIRYQSYLNTEDTTGTFESEAIDIDNVLLRGCILRNVSWVLCCVVATGEDTKIMLNSGVTPTKRTKMAKALNKIVFMNFFLLFVMCFAAGLINGLFYRKKGNSRTFFEYKPYAGWSPAANGAVDFFVNLILYQTLVPISLYITIEIIKAFQAFFIYSDVQMYYEEKDMPCTPKTWTISDDLGQIEYVFSDKTGTLTQNVMEFRGCTVHGKKYIGAAAKSETEEDEKKKDVSKDQSRPPTNSIKPDLEKDSNMYFQLNEKRLSVAGSISVPFDSMLLEQQRDQNGYNREFLISLALCHNVITKRLPDGKIEYHAESPDEAALVSAARDAGIEFLGGTRDGGRYLRLRSSVTGKRGRSTLDKYQLLQTIPFNSARKRMSVVVQTPQGNIVVYCKGADNVIYKRLDNSSKDASTVVGRTAIHLGEFAEEGLRTLCVAKRELTQKQFSDWKTAYDKASQCVDETREKRMEDVAAKLEEHLNLLGGTAIEDRLQDGVGESIDLIHRAGVKLWVLTGDKVETAISIGFSCRLLTNEMELIVIGGKKSKQSINAQTENMDGKLEKIKGLNNAEDVENIIDDMLRSKFNLEGTEEELVRARNDHSMPEKSIAVVVDGDALAIIMSPENKHIKRKFLLLCKQCQSVLCCRVSPAQKAEIVGMVKHGLRVMTLAIGDGANDVSMIQMANVGVGIAGQEGRQAAMASDYAIGQFRYLVRLLMVHGRWSYRRLAQMIPCFFYKNVVFVFPLFWYGIFCNFDGTYLYEFSYLMLFNLFFTSIPVITMGCLDQDVPAKVSLAVPELYRRGILNSDWSIPRFLTLYMLDGMYESFICFFFTWFLHWKGVFANQNGMPVDHRFWLGVFSAHIAVFSCNTYILLRQYRWDWLTLLFWFLSFAVLLFWTGVWTSSLSGSTIFYKAGAECYGTLSFWVLFAIGTFSSVIPRIAYDVCRQLLKPNDVDIIREQVRKGMYANLPSDYDPTIPNVVSKQSNVESPPAKNSTFLQNVSQPFKNIFTHNKKKSWLQNIKDEMVQEGQSSARSSLDGIRSNADIGISSPSNLMRAYTHNER